MDNTNIKTLVTKKKTVISYKEIDGLVVEKQCTKCALWFAFHEFTNSPLAPLGKTNACNNCESNRFTILNRKRGRKPKQPVVIEENGITKRPCSKCQSVKDLQEFDENPSGFLGHDSECRECKRRRSLLYRRNKGIRPVRTVPVERNELDEVTKRECARCRNMLELSQFNKHGGKTSTAYLGIHPYCKNCNSERTLIRKYGIDLDGKKKLHTAQNNACAVCHSVLAIELLVIDHCHQTGKTRGLLCNGCNKALGLLKDNSEWCLNMASYIDSHKGE